LSSKNGKYQWLLFDADGTLFDFDGAARAALIKTCEHFLNRFEPHFEPVYDRINRQIWRDFEAGNISPAQLRTKRFERFFAALAVEADPAAFSDSYLKSLSDHSDLYDGTAEVINQLAAIANLMIITNGLKEVQRPRFARATISKYFADFVISEEVGAAKPDPKIFAEAFRRMNNPARSEVLIIGDSLTSDIKGGNNYEIDTCWFNPARKPRDRDVEIKYEITHLAELLTIVAPD